MRPFISDVVDLRPAQGYAGMGSRRHGTGEESHRRERRQSADEGRSVLTLVEITLESHDSSLQMGRVRSPPALISTNTIDLLFIFQTFFFGCQLFPHSQVVMTPRIGPGMSLNDHLGANYHRFTDNRILISIGGFPFDSRMSVAIMHPTAGP